jgi:hypothetical protein
MTSHQNSTAAVGEIPNAGMDRTTELTPEPSALTRYVSQREALPAKQALYLDARHAVLQRAGIDAGDFASGRQTATRLVRPGLEWRPKRAAPCD